MGSEPPNPTQNGTDWSLEEVAAVVTDYFAMSADEIAVRHYNKREHNRAFQAVEYAFTMVRTVSAVSGNGQSYVARHQDVVAAGRTTPS